MAKILYVEDDLDLSTRVRNWLTEVDKHMVEHAPTASDAGEKLACFKYDLVILDVGLPDGTGIDVLKDFRGKGGMVPVLILTGQDAVDQKIDGLKAGADDYLTKPFDVRELSARLDALLRRPVQYAGDVITIGGVEIDTRRRSVKANGAELTIKPREFALLEFLIRHRNEVVSPDDILLSVWSSDSDATSETIYTHIKNLRKKLAAAGADSFIRTVHGTGYIVEG